jgi:hypothetical protein
MFNFNKRKINCPISIEVRIWMEKAFIWLTREFGEQKLFKTKQLAPTDFSIAPIVEDFERLAYDFLSIIAFQMDIDLKIIILNFYNDHLLEIENPTNTIFTQQINDENYSAGFYSGKDEKGGFNIAIERTILRDPEKLIATLAHELSHIKLLGEKRLKINDEYLTDLTTVFFGLGIFTANSSFKFYTQPDRWGYSKQGYLTQQEWGYALALFSHKRKELNPDWVKYLTPNIRGDFKKGRLFIENNLDKII